MVAGAGRVAGYHQRGAAVGIPGAGDIHGHSAGHRGRRASTDRRAHDGARRLVTTDAPAARRCGAERASWDAGNLLAARFDFASLRRVGEPGIGRLGETALA